MTHTQKPAIVMRSRRASFLPTGAPLSSICAPPAFLPRVTKRMGTKRFLSMQHDRVEGRQTTFLLFFNHSLSVQAD